MECRRDSDGSGRAEGSEGSEVVQPRARYSSVGVDDPSEVSTTEDEDAGLYDEPSGDAGGGRRRGAGSRRDSTSLSGCSALQPISPSVSRVLARALGTSSSCTSSSWSSIPARRTEQGV